MFRIHASNIVRKTSSSWPSRLSSTHIRRPPSSAPREAPTPLVFLSAGKWDPNSRKGMNSLSTMCAEKGFTCLESDLSLPESNASDSASLMEHFAAQLKAEIRLSAIPFPPVLFARSAAALIAHTYVSSNPACGLFLISPPASNTTVHKQLLPTPLPEFDYELKFPLAVLGTPKQISLLRAESRLGDDNSVDLISVNDMDSQPAFNKMLQWLDELGV